MELKIENAGKTYPGGVKALTDFSLSVGPGVLGLLGPNGAGKTTLMKILATVTKPTSGSATWDGVDIVSNPDTVRAVLGYLPQDFGIYPNLNPEEFLEYIAAAKGLSAASARRRIAELLELLNLIEARRRPLGGFSGGMRQRVGIAQALLNDPKLLIVDEPTAGLDPQERVRFRSLLTELSGQRIILLSTHIVSDVEATAMSIALISHGRLVRHASPEDLVRTAEGRVWEWLIASEELMDVKQRHVISGTIRRREGIRVRVVSEMSPDSRAASVAPGLEDAYLLHVAPAHGGAS